MKMGEGEEGGEQGKQRGPRAGGVSRLGGLENCEKLWC